jgi:hypothetical protein
MDHAIKATMIRQARAAIARNDLRTAERIISEIKAAMGQLPHWVKGADYGYNSPTPRGRDFGPRKATDFANSYPAPGGTSRYTQVEISRRGGRLYVGEQAVKSAMLSPWTVGLLNEPAMVLTTERGRHTVLAKEVR